ncbi:hypothetical protein [Fluviicola taffensis]|uniref:hypothetical protein n=1 Tax=Fluviicola taffensis TaxID=191579 RepID=UPI003137B5A1
MKQNTLKWLSCSLILLVALSCKKKKGALDDFDSGRFDFVCIWNNNGVQDTTIGEVSGPYLQSMNYYFRVKQELGGISSLKEFKVGTYKGMTNTNFYAPALYIDAIIASSDHDSDNLFVSFESGSMLSGTFKLTRKQ